MASPALAVKLAEGPAAGLPACVTGRSRGSGYHGDHGHGCRRDWPCDLQPEWHGHRDSEQPKAPERPEDSDQPGPGHC